MWTRGSWLLMLFGKAMGLVGGRTLLEEVCHRAWALCPAPTSCFLSSLSYSSSSSSSLWFLYVDGMCSLCFLIARPWSSESCCYVFLSTMDALNPLWNCKPKHDPLSSLSCFCHTVLSTEQRSNWFTCLCDSGYYHSPWWSPVPSVHVWVTVPRACPSPGFRLPLCQSSAWLLA